MCDNEREIRKKAVLQKFILCIISHGFTVHKVKSLNYYYNSLKMVVHSFMSDIVVIR